jgi:SOS response regulatory protein OraA/RecX
MGISDELLVKYELKVDDMVSQELIDGILIQEEKLNIKNRMLRQLRHRIRSTHELELRFQRDGYDQNLVREVIQGLCQEGILNNEQMAWAFINDNTNINPHGNQHIISELKKRGVSEEVFKDILAQRDEKEIALKFFNKKLNMFDLNNIKEKRKAINRLLSRGFTPSIVYEIINEKKKGEHDQ